MGRAPKKPAAKRPNISTAALNLSGMGDALIVRIGPASERGPQQVYIITRADLRQFERTNLTAADRQKLNGLFEQFTNHPTTRVQAAIVKESFAFDGA